MCKSCSLRRSVIVSVNQRESRKEEKPNESWNYGEMGIVTVQSSIYDQTVSVSWFDQRACFSVIIVNAAVCLQGAGIMEIVNCCWDCCSHAEILYYQNGEKILFYIVFQAYPWRWPTTTPCWLSTTRTNSSSLPQNSSPTWKPMVLLPTAYVSLSVCLSVSHSLYLSLSLLQSL